MPTPSVETKRAEPRDPEAIARRLRDELACAKARMRAYREEMEASGLARPRAPDEAKPTD